MSLDDTVPPAEDDPRLSRRNARYEARRLLWRITDVRRFAYCGRFVSDGAAGVTIRVTGKPGTPEARAGFSGLQTCGSVWSCPVCSEKVNAHRQAELEAGLEKWIANGGAVVFGTFTLRHNSDQSLAELWDAIMPAWNKVAAGASWAGGARTVGDKTRFGIEGWCRVVEVKHGDDHGWHPHIHVLFFLCRELEDQELDDMRSRLFGRWETALAKKGMTAQEFDVHGRPVAVDLRRVSAAAPLADYFAKNTYAESTSTTAAAYEVTGSQSKQAGKGGRTPFQILAQLVNVRALLDRSMRRGDLTIAEGGIWYDVETGEVLDELSSSPAAADLGLWREWEKTSQGRRQFGWSRGMRDLLGLGDELDDQAVVELDELDGEELSLIGIAEWNAGGWAYKSEQLLNWAERGELRERLPWAWSARRATAGVGRDPARGD